jgi:hypothetical protein
LADSRANSRDHSGGFVAEDPRGGVGSGGDFLEIGAADPAGMDPEQEFTGANLRHRNRLQADIVDCPVNGGQHGCRDGLFLVIYCELFDNCHRRSLDEILGASLHNSVSRKLYFWVPPEVLGSVSLNSTETVIESRYGESGGVK